MKCFIGSNWIPISAFPAQQHSTRLKFLFKSITEANFNVLRVWGGGMYETDEFYNLADKYGILIWQDLMFACSLYPTNKEFINNVLSEVEQQVYFYLYICKAFLLLTFDNPFFNIFNIYNKFQCDVNFDVK